MANRPWLDLSTQPPSFDFAQLTPDQVTAARLIEHGHPATDAPRLLIGPVNWAGQAHAWAQAVTRHLAPIQASNLVVQVTPNHLKYGFKADKTVLRDAWRDPLTRLSLAYQLIEPATHIIVEDLYPLLAPTRLEAYPGWWAELAEAEIEQLLAGGKKVALMLHGTSGRFPLEHRGLYQWSPFSSPELVEETAERVSLIRSTLAKLEIPVLVSTLDMLDFVEEAIWLPVVLSEADFAAAPPWRPAKRLKVAHVPSAGPYKGSGVVDRELGHLERLGLIEYLRMEGLSSSDMPAAIRQADVVVDQVVLGNPGVLLAQGMASGRLAVAHLPTSVRNRFDVPPPVVQADAGSLADVIADIACNPNDYGDLAAAGVGFVRDHHDGRLSAEVLRPWLKGDFAIAEDGLRGKGGLASELALA